MSRIELSGVRFRWPRASHDCLAIDDLRVAAGRSLFLFGPSGSGKSTLLGLLAGVLLPQAGSVSVDGVAWRRLSASARDAHRAGHVGYIFQQFNLLPYLSVIDNVVLACSFSAARRVRAQADAPTVRQAAQALLSAMGLTPADWARPAALLSVGQQQRVAAARALIGRPAVVIADEPTSALDTALRETFMALLLRQCREAGTTLVFVSHDERLSARFDESLSLPDINRAAPQPGSDAPGAPGATA